MRILMIVALFGGSLFAQMATPPPTPDSSAAWKHTMEDIRDMLQKSGKLSFSFRDNRRAAPSNAQREFVLAPGQACAIPLLNVAPKGGSSIDPKIVIPGSENSGNIDHMPAIQPPAPSCADVKR